MKSRGSTCTHQNNGITTLTYLTITETGEMQKRSTPEPLDHRQPHPCPGSPTIMRPKAASQCDPQEWVEPLSHYNQV